MKDYRDLICKNAVRLRELKAKVSETLKIELHGTAHHAACAQFHAEYDSLAFPGGLDQSMVKLMSGDPDVVEIAIQYLQVKPRFFRSGYIAEYILHGLKRAELTPNQITRLAGLIIDSITAGDRRSFVGYARLAGSLRDARILDASRDLSNDSRPEVKRRAQRILDIMSAAGL